MAETEFKYTNTRVVPKGLWPNGERIAFDVTFQKRTDGKIDISYAGKTQTVEGADLTNWLNRAGLDINLQPIVAETELGIDKETIKQLLMYLQVLYKLNRGEQELGTIFRQHELELEQLFFNHFDKRIPRSHSDDFRNYGDRKQEILDWERQQPNGTNLLRRPDGIRGVFIKHDVNKHSWYEIPSDWPEALDGDFFQTVIAKNLIAYLFVGKNLAEITADFTQEQIDNHFAWVTQQIAGK